MKGLVLIASVFAFILLVSFFTKYWNRLNEKFRLMGFKLDYQLDLLSALVVMVIGFVFLAPVISWMMHNIPALIGILVTVCYPICIMLLRPNTFQKVLNIDPDFRIYRIFIVFSFIAGGFFVIDGFSLINFNYPLSLALTMIFIGIIGQTIPLLPDYIEKITQLNLGMDKKNMNNTKSRNALVLLGSLSVVTFLILRFITESI